jgi:hypothetical protein
MSEIKRYFTSDMQLHSGETLVVFAEHLEGQLCRYEDVAPIIQRNAELEAELTRLREQKPAQELPAELVEWDNTPPIDCRQCVNFVWRYNSCGCIYICVKGSQYKPSNHIQVFRKE